MNQAFSAMTERCITCYQSWSAKVVKRDFKIVYMPLRYEKDHDHQIIPAQKSFQYDRENLHQLP